MIRLWSWIRQIGSFYRNITFFEQYILIYIQFHRETRKRWAFCISGKGVEGFGSLDHHHRDDYILYIYTLRIPTPDDIPKESWPLRSGYLVRTSLNTPASYRFVHPSIWGSKGLGTRVCVHFLGLGDDQSEPSRFYCWAIENHPTCLGGNRQMIWDVWEDVWLSQQEFYCQLL